MTGDGVMTLGVVGAGTMGGGIAQLGIAGGMPTTLVDPDPAALERASARIGRSLARSVEAGRLPAADAAAAQTRLRLASEHAELAAADLIIEAAPEDIGLKRALFAELASLSPRQVLATNTSSLMVAAIASAVPDPERVVGMHFFNPPERMRLVEIVAGPDTGERALAVARRTAEAMGRRAIDVLDRPGFLVNRCLRPFYSEGLKLLEEGIASFEQIDRILRLGGGFRMGTFELLDLVGLDVNLEVTRSFYAQSSNEPRWKPSSTQERLVAAGRLGRKSGRGFYDYADGDARPPDPADPADPARHGHGEVAIVGDIPLAAQLRERALEAGFDVNRAVTGDEELVVDATLDASARPASPDVPRVVLCARHSLGQSRDLEAVGFHALPPLEDARLVELTALPAAAEETLAAADSFFAQLGFQREWVRDAPGLVLGRVVCQVFNEVAFAIGEGVAAATDVDEALVLALNHPRGPVEWVAAAGLDHVLAVLDGLWEERREERYRPAPLLRATHAAGNSRLELAPIRSPRAAAPAG